MTAPPSYLLRSYGGNAWPAYLVSQMGATDLTFALVPAPGGSLAGWVEPSGSPLGTSGFFDVEVDVGLPTAEKILCSSINLTSGVVNVATGSGWNGRGNDQSGAQVHQPQSANGGLCRPCLTANEMRESNLLVNALMGQTPSDGQLVQWSASAGKPTYVTGVAGITGVPAGRIFAGTGQSFASGATDQLVFGSTGTLKGGMTVGTNSLIIPATGLYIFSAQVYWQLGTTLTRAVISVFNNGTLFRQADGGCNSSFTTVNLTDQFGATAGDIITVSAAQTNSAAMAVNTISFNNNFLSLAMVSA